MIDRIILLAIVALLLLRLSEASSVDGACSLGNQATNCDSAGHFCDTAETLGAGVTCQLVPIGSYSAENTGAALTCGAEYTTPGTGTGGATAQAACECAAGYGRSSTDDACVACTAPSFKIASGDAICSSCAIGEFYDTDNTYDGTTDQCESCGAEYTSGAGTSGASAQAACECAAGYGRSSDAAACVAFTAPSFKIDSGDLV
jgi:hypothetical protein